MSMLIEFAGVPGSGKTHVCGSLREWLAGKRIDFIDVEHFIRKRAARDINKIPKFEASWMRAKLDLGHKSADVFLNAFSSFFRTHHQYVHQYSSCLFNREEDETLIQSVLLTFFYCCARYAYCIDRNSPVDGKILLHEEGFSHRLFTLFGYDRVETHAEADIRAVARCTPVPQIVFWTRCSPTVAMERMSRRTGKKFPERIEGLDRLAAEQMLARGEANLKIGLDVLSQRGAEIIEIPTDKDFCDASGFDAVLAGFADRFRRAGAPIRDAIGSGR
ncbi:MAG: hypothetical protein IT539_07810 [Bradyrhizobiaceae bacterium]|nr:hypothetical protein [Bradyrhizobiaceae bacterium]